MTRITMVRELGSGDLAALMRVLRIDDVRQHG
jgi:hypothetical protein